ncbi:hypothetical protein N7492_008992 [Penicillium capsulatum]|uniref:Uncharacterized protein n=1 Tax=Penicillium capsulatum TaxID=69766 RepID=A0A9W9HTR3_9EURO|nr:hypothetical protein N7492_008992 [Penicillium capsulatum]KAJ6106392.1 hypothetical protein N7512_009909 [Penicillium capsulatum]
MPPKSAAPNPRSCTLLFKKHRTTVLLSLQPWQTIESAKETLLESLRARGYSEVGGASLPQAAPDIEFGVPVDRSDLEQGWRPLQVDPTADNDQSTEENSTESPTIEGVGLSNGHLVAFRFRQSSGTGTNGGAANDGTAKDLGWDVEIPRYADEDEEEI